MKETYFLLQTYEIFLKILYFKLLQEYLKNEIIGFTDCENNEETAYYTVTDIQRSITEVYDGISNLVWKSGYTAFAEIAGETVDLIDFDGMYTGCDYDAETRLTYHRNRWRSEDGSSFISEDPARDDSKSYYDNSFSFIISKTDFENALNFVNKASPKYNLYTNNCVDFAIKVADKANVKLPEFGIGSNPSTLNDVLQLRDLWRKR